MDTWELFAVLFVVAALLFLGVVVISLAATALGGQVAIDLGRLFSP